jgi:SAM-dependent methyltransferase
LDSTADYKPHADLAERLVEVAPSYAARGRKRETLERTVAAIDRDRWAALRQKYAADLSDFHPRGIFKYADLPFWIAHKVDFAYRAGLADAPPADILDIGMGGGHFGAVAQALGHRVVGTDISVPFYDDLAAMLGVERRIVPVKKGVRLPDLGRRFDRIFSIWQVFDIVRAGTDTRRAIYWTLDDWLFLLSDLLDNHLRLGGQIYLLLNQQVFPDVSHFDPELMAWAEARGAVRDAALGELVFEDLVPGSGFFRRDGPIPAPRVAPAVKAPAAPPAKKRSWLQVLLRRDGGR